MPEKRSASPEKAAGSLFSGFSPRALLGHADALARGIGPRPTGREGEARAAAYVRERMDELSPTVEEERFRAVFDTNAFPLSAGLIHLLATAVYPWTTPTGWVAAGLAFLAAWLLWRAITTADSPFRRFLPRVESRNVVARFASAEAPTRAVVVLSHLDSNRCRFTWCADRVRVNRAGAIGTLSAYALTGALYLIGAASGSAWPYLASLPIAAYGLSALILLLAELRRPYSAGANDNAASVAVNLELARRLSEDPLRKTEVRLAFTGAEEVDHRGIKHLLRTHPELRNADFLVLEGVGAGELRVLAREGLLVRYRPDPELLASAERVAAHHPEWVIAAGEAPLIDEVQTLRRLGCRALCLAGRDPATGTLPHWHTRKDIVENLSGETMARAAAFVWATLRELDRKERS